MPETVTIMGVPYAVKLVDVVDKTQLCFAQIYYFACEIGIDKSLPDERRKVALLHEVLHGICDMLGLEELNNNEGAIQSLAGSLYSTFKGTVIFS